MHKHQYSDVKLRKCDYSEKKYYMHFKLKNV